MSKADRRIKGLGEVSIRVKDLDAMQKFYEEVVGLEVLAQEENYLFFRMADGYGGHSQDLALFDMNDLGFLDSKISDISHERSTLPHIALHVSLEHFEAERLRLEGLGLTVRTTVHEWLHFCSLYFPDPERNLVELVCYDASPK